MKQLWQVLAMSVLAGCMISSARAQQAVQPAQPGLHIEVLTDTSGVNLTPYLQRVVAGLRSRWQALNPPGEPAFQETILTLTIADNGELTALQVERPTQDDEAAKAAWTAAKDTHFAPLPTGLKQTPLKLRVSFVTESSPAQ